MKVLHSKIMKLGRTAVPVLKKNQYIFRYILFSLNSESILTSDVNSSNASFVLMSQWRTCGSVEVQVTKLYCRTLSIILIQQLEI
jgi:hypothetical protein